MAESTTQPRRSAARSKHVEPVLPLWLTLLLALYYAYSYLMYVVAPFNDVFLLYVAAIGLATYGLFNGLVRLDIHTAAPAFASVRTRALAYFLLVVGTLFVGLWLSQIIPAIPGGVPDGLFVYDIPSTVHVLDLAYILPLIVATGFLLLRGRPVAPVLAVLMLVKMVTLGLALLLMAGFVVAGGGVLYDSSEPYMWGAITVISAGWLYGVMRRIEPAPPGWLRPTLWPQS